MYVVPPSWKSNKFAVAPLAVFAKFTLTPVGDPVVFHVPLKSIADCALAPVSKYVEDVKTLVFAAGATVKQPTADVAPIEIFPEGIAVRVTEVFPITVVFDPNPHAVAPITIELVSVVVDILIPEPRTVQFWPPVN